MPRQHIENLQSEFSPAVTVVELTDPTTVGEDIEILRQDLVQLETKPLRARQIYVRLDDSLVLFQSTNVRLRVRTSLHNVLLVFVVFGRTSLHNVLLVFVVFGPQAEGTLNGLPIGPNLFLTAESGSHAELVVKAGYESVTVMLSPDVLVRHLADRQREDTFRVPHGIEVLHTDESNARRLFDWGKRLANTAAHHPELFNDRKKTLVAVQTELLEMLLAAIDTTSVPRHTRSYQTRQARTRVVRLAEDYALAHTEDRLCVTDLCVATGVSERTLQYAFQEVMGMSPLAYLTRLRLHRVRKALRMGTYGSTTVSTEALRWGFWHFGDFSRAYKDCFGELPSESLRRKPAETNIRRR
ncbi:MAG: transcriptional regulator EutR [Geobacteraceae bacterium]|nr:transcriptional regulator EutR [Geobacteraceae bacterium]